MNRGVMLSVIGRSQRGRTCEYSRGDRSVRTPFAAGSSDDAEIFIETKPEGRIQIGRASCRERVYSGV